MIYFQFPFVILKIKGVDTMIDFNKNCSVLFFFETEKGEVTMLQYERPQFIDDAALDKEACDQQEI